jgi:hypothetical protein
MGKSKTRKDPIFGDLVHVVGDLWQRGIELSFLGKNWRSTLMVSIGRSGPEENQNAAYKIFAENTASVVEKAENAILDYYHSDDFRSTFGPPDPKIESAQQMVALVELEGVTFPYVCPCPTFGFLCKCSWDPELGLAVKFENGSVGGVGEQEIIL